jgi:hypothetical protein
VNAWYAGNPDSEVFIGTHTCRPNGRIKESVKTIGFSMTLPFSSRKTATPSNS